VAELSADHEPSNISERRSEAGERRAVAVVFAVHGAIIGTFATRIPWIAAHVHLSPGTLGISLLMLAAGGIAAMQFSGPVMRRLGGRRASRLLIGLMGLLLPVAAFAPDLGALCLALLLYTAAGSLADVAMNAQGVLVEKRTGRSEMSRFHGMWSAGLLVASVVGALAAHARIDARLHFAVVGAVLASIGCLAAGRFRDEAGEADDRARSSASDERPPRFVIPRGLVLAVGLVAFCAIFIEGASTDWCAVYLRDVTKADPGIAALAVTVVALAMAAGRFAGDHVVERIGAVRAVQISGVLTVLGGVLVVSAVLPVVVFAGFAMLGLGISIVVPLGFAAAGRTGTHPDIAIAGVATVGYGAGLAGPALIGGIADLSSLRVSFAVVTLIGSVIVIFAGVLRNRDEARAARRSGA
jgi:MFS family permease